MNNQTAKDHLDTVIKKARVHFYKPIQIAEILWRDRIEGDIDLGNLETYRTPFDDFFKERGYDHLSIADFW